MGRVTVRWITWRYIYEMMSVLSTKFHFIPTQDFSNTVQRKKPPNWILHKPLLPIAYGTHHSKAMLLVYPKGVRIIVHTANLIFVDWNNKSQGLWMQDFPWKDQSSPSKGSEFEADLVDYLSALKVYCSSRMNTNSFRIILPQIFFFQNLSFVLFSVAFS